MWGIGARAETHLPPAPSFSVMHYRPLSFLGVSSGLDLLSRETYTHRRTHTHTRARAQTHTHMRMQAVARLTFQLAERDLISNMGLSYSAPRSRSILQSALM